MQYHHLSIEVWTSPHHQGVTTATAILQVSITQTKYENFGGFKGQYLANLNVSPRWLLLPKGCNLAQEFTFRTSHCLAQTFAIQAFRRTQSLRGAQMPLVAFKKSNKSRQKYARNAFEAFEIILIRTIPFSFYQTTFLKRYSRLSRGRFFDIQILPSAAGGGQRTKPFV